MKCLTCVGLAAALVAWTGSAASSGGSDVTIAGHVRDADGVPMAGLEIRFYRDNVSLLAVTEDDGSYTLEGAPGTYAICTGGFATQTIRQCWDHVDQIVGNGQQATPVTLGPGDVRSDIDFDLSYGGSISGRVVDAFTGLPLANTQIGVTVTDLVHIDPGQAGTTTDADGRYRVRGVPAGEWYVKVGGGVALVTEFWPDVECSELTCDTTGADIIAVAAGADVDGIDFALHPDVVIKGRVTDATTGAGLAGIAVHTYWIFELPFGSEVYPMTTATTDASGDYALYGYGALESSDTTYYVGTLGSAPYIDVAWPDTPFIDLHDVENGTPFALRHDTEIDGIDLALPQGGAVSGIVRDLHTGAPLRQASVTLFASEGHVLASLQADADGRYTMPAWYAGTYYVEAWSWRGTNACEVWFERPCGNGSVLDVDPTPLVLSANELRGDVNFMLDTDLILQTSFEWDEPGFQDGSTRQTNPLR